MRLLGIVQFNLQRLGSLMTTVISSVMGLMLKPLSGTIGVLGKLKTQYAHLWLLNSLRVQTGLKTNRLVVNLITVEQLIKQELTTAKQTLIQIGSQLVTIVRQTLQHVLSLVKLNNALVVNIKLVLSPIQKQVVVLIHMVSQLKGSGLKLLETVRQLPQRVLQALFKGR